MQSEFKTQELAKNFDWNAIYPTEQSEMQSALNYNFNLQDIQNFLKKESKNFTNLTPELYDLDRYLYSIYYKSIKTDEPTPPPAPESTPAEEDGEITKAKKELADILELIEISDGADLKKLKKEKKDLQELIDLLS